MLQNVNHIQIFESSCTFDILDTLKNGGNMWHRKLECGREWAKLGGIQNQQNGKFQFQSIFVWESKTVSGHRRSPSLYNDGCKRGTARQNEENCVNWHSSSIKMVEENLQMSCFQSWSMCVCVYACDIVGFHWNFCNHLWAIRQTSSTICL